MFLSMRSNASFPNKTLNSVFSFFHSLFVYIPELPRSHYINYCYAIYSSSVSKVHFFTLPELSITTPQSTLAPQTCKDVYSHTLAQTVRFCRRSSLDCSFGEHAYQVSLELVEPVSAKFAMTNSVLMQNTFVLSDFWISL